MIEYLPASTPSCFVVKFSGKLHGDEYRDLIAKVESAVQEQSSVSMVLMMHDLTFPEWDAINADAHFGRKDLSQLTRAAYVGDKKRAEWFVKLTSPFTRAEERSFPLEELNEAVQWASGQ
jgi:hypothetical protein